jgi:hypothetical protein
MTATATAPATRWRVLAQAVPGTAHALRWRPLLGVAGVLLAAALLARQSDRPADGLLAVSAAALASSVVTGLHDPATRLLAAVPVSRALRRLVRLGLVTTPVLVVWWLITSTVGAVGDARSPVPVLALAAAGVAVAVWLPERYGVLVGSMVPVLWFALGLAAPVESPLSDVAGWWRTDPWPVLAVCLLGVGLAGRQR